MEINYSYYEKHWTHKFELSHRDRFNSFDNLKNHFLKRYPAYFTDDVNDYDQVSKYKNQTDYVWLIDKSITPSKSFPWFFRVTDNKFSIIKFPFVYKNKKEVHSWKKVQLVSTDIKKITISKQRYICGIYDPYYGNSQFDLFYIQEKDDLSNFTSLKNRFQDLKLVKSIQEAVKLSKTDMVWIIPDDVIVDENFNFDYEPAVWSYNLCHMFQNGNDKNYNGILLIPKNYELSDREISYRYFTYKRLVNINASKPENYDIFSIKSFKDLKNAQTQSKTKLFWAIFSDFTFFNDFNYNYKVQKWEENNIYKLLDQNTSVEIYLIPKNVKISHEEFINKSFKDQKEIII